MKKSVASLTVAASLIGGAAGAVIFAPSIATAQEEAEVRTSWVDETLQGLVDDDTLSQEQADAVAEALEAARPERPDRGGPKGHLGGRGPGRDLDVLTDTLGLDAEELRDALMGGQSLADIAADQGVDQQTLIDALVAEAQAHLDEAVESGRLDEADVAERLADITEKITAMVNGEIDFGGRGGPHPGGPHPDGPGPLGGDEPEEGLGS